MTASLSAASSVSRSSRSCKASSCRRNRCATPYSVDIHTGLTHDVEVASVLKPAPDKSVPIPSATLTLRMSMMVHPD